MSSFTNDLIAVLKSRVTVIGCGLITSVITARYLGPSGNGIVATLTVYPDLFMVIGSLGIRQSAAYFIGQKKYSDDAIFSSVLNVWLFTSLFCIASCFLLLKYAVKGNYDSALIFLALLPIPFSLFNTYSSGVFLGKNMIKDFNTVNWVPNVVKLIAFLILIVLLPWGVKGAIIGIGAGYMFLTYFVWGKVKNIVKIQWSWNFQILKEMLSLGIIYAVSLLIISLNYKANIMLLQRLSSEYEVGIYSKGVSIVEYLWEVPTLLSTIIFARSVTSTDPKLFSEKVCQLLRICFVVIFCMSVVFYFISEFLMVTMYGSPFKASSEVQKILLPGILLMTIFKVLNMDLAGKGKPWMAVIAALPALLLNVFLNWLWDEQYGAKGAAMASTISYTVSAIIFLIMYSRYVQIPIKSIVKISLNDFNFLDKYINKLRR
ncbi:polysaccharide biosynthesis C-terminal domain-containing protein [Dyadobacter sp. CY312]|uniref:oligosaccharide flippase family protein n=1 Tax=Dyadobacter sp. CY312 TaxID=2907303 RepID=UPI001F3B12AB|nr:polysaccharide biosynthesis C-terminal domain-containing protein [Dyadobacter sp. CY312]MCE7040503.1 polysaccharide biosynthesis C-terminal domain-containing protein [Dyadobacter sp. CY312]